MSSDTIVCNTSNPHINFFTLSFFVAPSPVMGVIGIATSNSTITIRWDPPLSPNGILIFYRILVTNRLSQFSFSTTVLPSRDSAREVNVTGLGKDSFVPCHDQC